MSSGSGTVGGRYVHSTSVVVVVVVVGSSSSALWKVCISYNRLHMRVSLLIMPSVSVV